jgi:hypothetical protein
MVACSDAARRGGPKILKCVRKAMMVVKLTLR